MKKTAAIMILALSTAWPHAYSLAADEASFPVVRLQAGLHLIKAEVADTPARREQGLMFRKHMPANDGMLFDFGAPAGVCMWMKNTHIPLSVAFIDAQGVIINIENMRPMTKQSHCAERPVRYALEMNQGWFRKKGVAPGSKIAGLP